MITKRIPKTCFDPFAFFGDWKFQQKLCLGIQSPCQMMIGVYNHLLSKVFSFHYHSQKVIGSLGFVKLLRLVEWGPSFIAQLGILKGKDGPTFLPKTEDFQRKLWWQTPSLLGCPVGSAGKGLGSVGYNLLINGVYWGYNLPTNLLQTSWDIQVCYISYIVNIATVGNRDCQALLRVVTLVRVALKWVTSLKPY